MRRKLNLRLLLFVHISQGFHNMADHLAHVLGHHHGPLGLLRKRNPGYDSRSRLSLHHLIDCKVASGRERRNDLNGHLHLRQPRINR